MANLGQKNIAQLITVVVGSPQTLEAAGFTIPYPVTLHITPGSTLNSTITVKQRGSATGEFHNIPLPTATPGIFSAYDVVKLDGGVEALQFTAAVSDGIVELAQ